MARVLIIDDDPWFGKMLTQSVEYLGHEAFLARTLQEGLAASETGGYDLVYLDLGLPDGYGLDALPQLKEAPSHPEIVIVTGADDPDGAELAVHSGAWDYVQKPASLEKLSLPLLRALEYRRRKSDRPITVFHREAILGSSPALRGLVDRLAEASASEANVLLSGETGTGKDLCARAVHANSSRAERPFVVVDCAAIPDTLLESELFGYLKGAFTGAHQNREGLIRQAHGGTLFLDEIGELSLLKQKTFLRVIQERTYRPLGSTQEQTSDFRLVSATNKDLDELVRQGKFREDLLFRLRAIAVPLPPLRERGEDTVELAMAHTARLCHRYNMDTKGFSPDFFEALRAYSWPGNVRELHAVLELVLASAGADPILFPHHLPTNIRASVARQKVRQKPPPEQPPASAPAPEGDHPGLPAPWKLHRAREMDRVERRYLRGLLALTGGNVSKAAHLAGLSRPRLYAMLRKHGLFRAWTGEDPEQTD